MHVIVYDVLKTHFSHQYVLVVIAAILYPTPYLSFSQYTTPCTHNLQVCKYLINYSFNFSQHFINLLCIIIF
jgi:hypothetical protein